MRQETRGRNRVARECDFMRVEIVYVVRGGGSGGDITTEPRALGRKSW